MKYDWKFKLNCVRQYKEGKRDFACNGRSKSSFLSNIKSWVIAFDDFGIDGLKHQSTNKCWNSEDKLNLVLKVLAGNSLKSVADNAHLNSGQLYLWVNKYREKGIDGLKYLQRGRPRTKECSTDIMPKKKIKLSQTEQEELKLLRERNKYLEAENLYLKKLRALELEKTAKLAKVKNQESSKPSK